MVKPLLDPRSNGSFDYRYLYSCGEVAPADELSQLVGVAEDKETGSVIVTYRHLIERFRLSKDSGCHVKVGQWETKFNLTSAAVYDVTLGKYVGVFHGHTVGVWGHETSDLGQADKYTFRMPILKILTRQGKVPLIVFRNGDCVTLPRGLQQCGTFRRRAPVREHSAVADVAAYTRSGADCVCYVVRDSRSDYHITTMPIVDEVADISKMSTVNVSKTRQGEDGIRITGIKLIVPSGVDPLAYITWNDSRVSKYDLIRKHCKHKVHNHWWGDDVTMSGVGKNYVFLYAKTSQQEPQMSVRHVFNGSTTLAFGNEAKSHSTKTEAILCKTGDFMVVADQDKIVVWNVEFKPYSRSPLWRENVSGKLLDNLRNAEEYLPIFGYSELSKWNRTSRNRTVK